MGKPDAVIKRLWLQCTQQPDEDGACKRCGLVWQEEDITEPHECPPGFQDELEIDLRAVLAYVAELERVNEAAQICVRNWKAGAVTMNWVIDTLAAALTGGEKGGGDT